MVSMGLIYSYDTLILNTHISYNSFTHLWGVYGGGVGGWCIEILYLERPNLLKRQFTQCDTHFASAHCDADTMCSTLPTFLSCTFNFILTMNCMKHTLHVTCITCSWTMNAFFYWELCPSKNSEACTSSLSPTIKKNWRFCFFKTFYLSYFQFIFKCIRANLKELGPQYLMI